jgi:hypothetical protein
MATFVPRRQCQHCFIDGKARKFRKDLWLMCDKKVRLKEAKKHERLNTGLHERLVDASVRAVALFMGNYTKLIFGLVERRTAR